MTVSILKQDPNTWKVQNNAILLGESTWIFRVIPFIKLQNELNGKKMMKKWDGELIYFWGVELKKDNVLFV